MYSHKVLLKHVEMNPFQVMVEDLKVYAYVGEEKKRCHRNPWNSYSHSRIGQGWPRMTSSQLMESGFDSYMEQMEP